MRFRRLFYRYGPAALVVMVIGGYAVGDQVITDYRFGKMEDRIERVYEPPESSGETVGDTLTVRRYSGETITNFLFDPGEISETLSEYQGDLEDTLEKEECFQFLHLAERVLKRIVSKKPVEPDADAERAKQLVTLQDKVTAGLKDEVTDADYCRKLIDGLAGYAVDAAIFQRRSRTLR